MRVIFTYESEFSSSFEEVDKVVVNLIYLIRQHALSASDLLLFKLEYAMRELLNNAVEHGNKFSVTKQVRFKCYCNKDHYEMEVIDEGEGFLLEDVLESENGPVLRVRNRGLLSLSKMGFLITAEINKVIARLPLDEETFYHERKVTSMDIQFKDDKAICIIDTSLTAPNIKILVEELKENFDEENNYSIITLDLSKSESVDSMGITFLIGCYKTFTSKGKTMKLSGVSSSMMQLFKIMKLDEVFEIEML